MIVSCPKCQHRYRVTEAAAGRTARCSKCQTPFVISPPEKPEAPEVPRSIDLDATVRSTRHGQPPTPGAEDAPTVIKAVTPGTADDKTPLLSDLIASSAEMAAPGTADSAPRSSGTSAIQHTPSTALKPGAVQRGDRKAAKMWQPGQVILGLYKVIDVIGEGGMGAVYRVHHLGWNLDLAVKSPRPEALESQHTRQLIVREAQAWVDIGLHPNVASCFYVREIDGVPRIFIELVDGGSLREWMVAGDVNNLDQIIDFAIQVCDGMQHAHSKGMIHRDLKPSNCLMTRSGNLKITDFGLVKIVDEGPEELISATDGKPIPPGDHSVSTVGGIQGTPGYIPPEQWRVVTGEARSVPVTRQGDIYSFGVQLFEMLCGRRPFDDGTLTIRELCERHMKMPPPDPAEFRKDIPSSLKEVIYRALQKKAEDRYQSFQDIRDHLALIYHDVTRKAYPRQAPHMARLAADSLNNRAISLFDLGKKADAEHALEEALAADPDHLESNYNRGLLEWRSGRVTDEELIRRLQEVVNSQPENWRAAYLLGIVHLERRNAVAAEKVLANACNHPEATAEAKLRWGDALVGCQKYSEALSVFRATVGIHSQPRLVQLRAAVALCLANEMEKAEALFGGPLPPIFQTLIYYGGGTCKTLEGHATSIGTVAISSDGETGASIGVEPERSLKFWNLPKGECILNVKLRDMGFTCVALSSCGRFALSGSTDRVLRYWDIKAKKCIWTFDPQKTDINFVVMAQERQRGISISSQGVLCVWNLAEGALERRARRMVEIRSIAFSANLDRAISTDGGSWFVWDIERLEEQRMAVRTTKISDLALSEDGRFALVPDPEGRIQYWDIQGQRIVRELAGHRNPVMSVAFGAGGKMAVSAGRDNTLRLWRLDTGKCIQTIPSFAGNLAPIAVSQDGRFCLWGGWDKTLRYFDLGTDWPEAPLVPARIVSSEDAIQRQNLAETLKEKAITELEQRRWKDAAQTVRQAREVPGHQRDAEWMRLWNEAGRGARRTALTNGWRLRTLAHPGPVTAACFLSDSQTIYTGDVQGGVRAWAVSSGEIRQSFIGHSSVINSIVASPDGKLLLTGAGIGRGGDATARLWDTESATQKRVFECLQGVTAVAFCPDSRMAMIGSREVLREPAIRVFDLIQGNVRREFEPEEPVSVFHFHPSGERIVAGSEDATLSVWDLLSGERVSVLEGHEEILTAAEFSPLGNVILSGSLDGTVRLWDASSFVLQRFLRMDSGVTSATFSPDGRFILVGGMNRTVQLWDAQTGERLRTFEGHAREVKTVIFSPNGRFALSTSADHTAILWELDWNYEFPEEEGTPPDLTAAVRNFLLLQCPWKEDSLQRLGPPAINDTVMDKLLIYLQHRGLGWMATPTLRATVENLVSSWKPEH